ncbi:class I SAM-dependent methyltransferase [Granulibacter bethesdensis]
MLRQPLQDRLQTGYAIFMNDSTDRHLADQYEAFPYPQRDPRDETKRLIIGSPSHLKEIDYWVFGANRPRSAGLRALVAGGGTGDGTIMLATHLARDGRPGGVTYLDRSAAALRTAQARAETRSLTVDFRAGSILDLPHVAPGPFDYIDCCGVLHHLPDPAEGLRALTSVLAPGGGMGLMVYAPHGRTGVYMLQDALRSLAPPEEEPRQRLDVAKRVMRHLPETAWLRRNRYFGDHFEGGDAGLYDLLLNPRDRAYTVPALHALLDNAGLEVRAWMEPLRYDPSVWLPDPKLRAKMADMTPLEKAALAENLAGNMSTHVVYCVRKGEVPVRADPLDPTAIPVAREMPVPELARAIRPDGVLPLTFDGLTVPLALPPPAAAILKLIDGTRSVGNLREMLGNRFSGEAFDRAWSTTFNALERANRLLLRAPD